jgi:hypothetical protein
MELLNLILSWRVVCLKKVYTEIFYLNEIKATIFY